MMMMMMMMMMMIIIIIIIIIIISNPSVTGCFSVSRALQTDKIHSWLKLKHMFANN